MPKRKKRKVFPKKGQKLVARNAGRQFTATVVDVDSGRQKVQVRLGRDVYASPSSAAKGITGYWVNGWEFWGIAEL